MDYSDALAPLEGARLLEVAFHAMGVNLIFAREGKIIKLGSHGVPTATENAVSFDAAMADLSKLLYPLIDHEVRAADWCGPGRMQLTFDNTVTVHMFDRDHLAIDYSFEIQTVGEKGIALLE